jgi:diguanylate cyclase (GGDEF)-like protein/PAS domain S-box-containing protein
MLTLSIVGTAVTTSVSELRHTFNALHESEQRYRTLFESASDSIFLMKGEQFIDCNPATLKMFGCTRELIIGEPPYRFSPELQPDGRSSKEKALEKITDALNTETTSFEWQHCRYDGTPFDAEVTLNPLKIGEYLYLLATVRDVSARKAAEKIIHQLAFFDPLTLLPNRQLLLDRLQQTLVLSARNGRTGALLFIDLDNFKNLNDTLGHEIGDMLLKQVTMRLESCIREGDTVARLGGDEFVVMLVDLSKQPIQAATLTEAVGEKIFSAIRMPYQLGKNTYRCTTSIGVTMFNGHQQSADELLKRADIAMFQAKKAGRNTMRFFDPEMQETINIRAALENDLRAAIENHQFHLYYQVQVDKLFRPLGAEALLRWNHPERGLILPAQFIPLAEETGLILPMGQWVLETACAQIKAWEQDARTCELSLAVNVSANQFHQADFVAHVQSALKRHAIDPKLLKLELTEGLLLKNIDDTIATMNALQNTGVRLSLDDFGTGYSSLQYLKKLPLDQLKIDQSFVRDLATDASDKMIVHTIIIMAQSLGLEVIAEGVETDEQQKFLMNNGCTNYQGYFFGEPVTIEEFERALKQI